MNPPATAPTGALVGISIVPTAAPARTIKPRAESGFLTAHFAVYLFAAKFLHLCLISKEGLLKEFFYMCSSLDRNEYQQNDEPADKSAYHCWLSPRWGNCCASR